MFLPAKGSRAPQHLSVTLHQPRPKISDNQAACCSVNRGLGQLRPRTLYFRNKGHQKEYLTPWCCSCATAYAFFLALFLSLSLFHRTFSLLERAIAGSSPRGLKQSGRGRRDRSTVRPLPCSGTFVRADKRSLFCTVAIQLPDSDTYTHE